MQESSTAIAIAVPLVLVMLSFAGSPVAINMGVAGFIGIWMLGEPTSLTGTILVESVNQAGLTSIPFYLLMGILLERTGMGAALVRFMLAVVGRFRGSMIVILGGSSVLFGGMSGSGPADAGALSSIFGRPMEERGYDRPFVAAMCAAGGTLGLVLPPSAGYILYAIIAGNTSIPDLFKAGIIPGLLLAVGFVISGLLTGMPAKTPQAAGPPPRRLREALVSLPGAAVGLGAPAVVLGGIYTGTFTVTEAAGIGAAYAIVAGIVLFRAFGWRDWIDTAIATAIASGVVFLIVAGAGVLRWLVTVQGWAVSFSETLTSRVHSPTLFLIAAAVIVLICGTVIDGIAMYFLLVPLFLPGVLEFGIDPVVFGVVFTVAVSIGLITPPLGIDIFAASSILNVPPELIIKRIYGPVLAGVVVLAIVIFVPQTVTALT